jgi:peptidyl-tRNA hydrolase
MIKRLINLTRRYVRHRHELSTLTLKMLLAFQSSFWSPQCDGVLAGVTDSQQWETILLHPGHRISSIMFLSTVLVACRCTDVCVCSYVHRH